jgi:hypothetical protein
MTEHERQTVRRLIDQAKRQRLDATGYRYCGYCGEAFEPTNWKQGYCNPTHRKQAWRRTPQGRVFARAADQRRQARRREEAAV